MRKLVIILFLASAQLGFGQTCDTIEGRTINCIDENGLKQGNWEYWKYEWRQVEYTGEVAGYCQTKPLRKVPIKLLKKGKFKDDKKVGKWEFLDDGGDYISTTRTEQYLDDGSVEVEESGFQSVYNHDSSIIKSIVLSGKDTIYINCEQKQCIGTYKSQQLVLAPLEELETEIDKIRWGSYAREIKTLKATLNNEYKILDYSRPNNIKVDTSIYIDFTSKEVLLDSLMNSNALLDYYNLLTPPPHGGDPNYATISVVVDVNGKAIHTYVVEDVKNKCNDDPWKLSTKKEVTFSPLVINGKPYITEYVFKITDLMYCVPLVYKFSTPKRKTFSFSDSSFEVGSIHRIKINYSYCHPPLYVDENQPIYDSIADFLKRNPNVKIEVSSHTDQRGTDKYNLLLSERRAENIMKQVLKLDIDSNQIISKGYGEEKPIIKLDEINKMTTSDEKEAAYAINRRNELKIISLKGSGQTDYTVRGVILCKESKKLVEGAEVKIVGTDGSSNSYITKTDGLYQFDLKKETSYSIVVFSKDHLTGKSKVTTVGHKLGDVITLNIEVEPMLQCGTAFLPVVSYNHNTIDPVLGDSVMFSEINYLKDIMLDNPAIVISVIGFRDSTETEAISAQRAKEYYNQAITMGVNKERLQFEDGGYGTVRKIITKCHTLLNPYLNIPDQIRTVKLRVIRDDYESKE